MNKQEGGKATLGALTGGNNAVGGGLSNSGGIASKGGSFDPYDTEYTRKSNQLASKGLQY